jgi:hypothetical protein
MYLLCKGNDYQKQCIVLFYIIKKKNLKFFIAFIISVYEKPVIKKDGCTSLCNVKGNTSAVAQQQGK